MSVLEKAWAKVHGGYKVLQVGFSRAPEPNSGVRLCGVFVGDPLVFAQREKGTDDFGGRPFGHNTFIVAIATPRFGWGDNSSRLYTYYGCVLLCGPFFFFRYFNWRKHILPHFGGSTQFDIAN